jgi:ribosomal protein S18 acetylase RimI-like enzyme
MQTTGAVTIRAAVPADAPALARLRFALRASVAMAWEPEAEFLARCTAWMFDRLAPGSAWRCWIAEGEQGIVGSVWLQLIEKIPNPGDDPERHAYVSNLYVAPDHRGLGLGTRLLQQCIAACPDDDVDKMILWPTPESRTLYQRHGFAVRDDLFARRTPHPDPLLEQ